MLLTASGTEQIKRLSPSISGLGRECHLQIRNNCTRCDRCALQKIRVASGDVDARLKHLKLSAQQMSLQPVNAPRGSEFQSQTRPIDGAVTKCNNKINCRGRQSSPRPFSCCSISFSIFLSIDPAVYLPEETQPLIDFCISRGRYCAINMTDTAQTFSQGSNLTVSQYEKH